MRLFGWQLFWGNFWRQDFKKQGTRGSAALRTLVTWVVLIASRDGFCNPLKPNSLDYHSYEFKTHEFTFKIAGDHLNKWF
jgi:hypothetical protein